MLGFASVCAFRACTESVKSLVYRVFMQPEVLSGQQGCHWARLRLNPVNTGPILGTRRRNSDMRILIVEDEASAAKMLSKGLREQTYAVDVASDGEDASYKASISDYDLIVLDVKLPRMNGFDVCRELRKAGSEVPILMLTALDDLADRVAGLDCGADDYLTKPYEYQELLARVRALLRRGSTRHLSTVRIDDLEVDLQARRVSRGGQAIELTAKEYALLEYLARRSGELVTRAEISEHVWDESYDPFSNVVGVYIQRLRQKIDATHAIKLLHTRRGEGYFLSGDVRDKNV
jgi:two-component system, OmpR family, copper resistance phosphate regulon response regulator CusR